MAKEMSPEERRVESWLGDRGYIADYEPAIIPPGSQRPDFWAETVDGDPSQLWAEVKHIDEDASTKAMSMVARIEREKPFPGGLFGQAHMSVHGATLDPSVRSVIKLFREKAPGFSGEKTTLAFVQQCEGVSLRRAEVHGDGGVKRLWVKGADAGPLACPYNFCDEHPYAMVDYWGVDGVKNTAPAYQVLNWTEKVQCSLMLWLDPSRPQLTSFSVSSAGSPNTTQRTVRLLEAANSQLRAAVAIRPAPALVFIVPRFDYVDDRMIQAGCYGVLKVPFNVKTGEAGHLYHGEDGVFRPTKNRHISAAIRLWSNGEATYFPNPYAHHKIDDAAKLFAGLHRASVEFAQGSK